MFEKIRKYLRERDVVLKPRTAFDDDPCFRCQEYDPYLNLGPAKDPWGDVSSPLYDPDRYQYEQHPCELRRNYCHTWKSLCKHFKEAGSDFWSSEKWRIENKEEYRFMNANMWRKVRSSCQKARKDV